MTETIGGVHPLFPNVMPFPTPGEQVNQVFPNASSILFLVSATPLKTNNDFESDTRERFEFNVYVLYLTTEGLSSPLLVHCGDCASLIRVRSPYTP